MSGDIRQLIDRQIAGDAQMAGMLAAYNGAPASFYQKAPSDSRRGWGEPRYPRIDFNVDMRYDPERKEAGTLTVNIWCTTECPAAGSLDPDRAIERRLMELISGTFYTGADGTTVCAVWERSDEFEYEGSLNTKDNTAPEVYGLTVTFGLMEFPVQISTAPDPVHGLNAWTKKHFPQVTAVAYDAMPPVWKPTDKKPAVYWRFEGAEATDRQCYAVTWFTGTFAAHVIAESVSERNKWTKAVIERAQMDGEVILADTSPMLLNRVIVRHNADPLREGQIVLKGQYGVLAQPPKEPAQVRLMHPHYNMAEGGMDGMYKASELAEQARRLFGTTPEAAAAALKAANKASATIEEAEIIIKEFLGREVK